MEGKRCSSMSHPAQDIQTPGMVVSVWGTATNDRDKFVPYFAQKGIHFGGEVGTMKHCVGVMSHRGQKPDSPNQDDFFLLARGQNLLLGVMDGHGDQGHHISHFAQQRLPKYLTQRLRKGELWEAVTSGAFKDLSNAVKTEMTKEAECSGTTASVATLNLDKDGTDGKGAAFRLRTAHVGDSMIVCAQRTSRSDRWEVTELTNLHKPDRDDERKRIQGAGGEVEESQGPGLSAYMMTPTWKLGMSRSIGDLHAHRYGLSDQPELSSEVILKEGSESFILACSDGVWDVIPPDQAVAFVGKFTPEKSQTAVERLISKAQRRWQEMGSHVDDITALLVWPGVKDPLNSVYEAEEGDDPDLD